MVTKYVCETNVDSDIYFSQMIIAIVLIFDIILVFSEVASFRYKVSK